MGTLLIALMRFTCCSSEVLQLFMTEVSVTNFVTQTAICPLSPFNVGLECQNQPVNATLMRYCNVKNSLKYCELKRSRLKILRTKCVLAIPRTSPARAVIG